jgi:hypothetical protein
MYTIVLSKLVYGVIMSSYTDKYVVFNENTKTCRYLKSNHVRVSSDNSLEFFHHSHERLVQVIPSCVFYCLLARKLSIRDYKRVFLKKIEESVITGKDIYLEYVCNHIISFDEFGL